MFLVRCLIVVLLVGTEVLGYPPQERVMPDGAPVPEDAVEHEDSMASASEVGEEYEDGDDSDMYMEPQIADTLHGSDHEENIKRTDESSVQVNEKKIEEVSSVKDEEETSTERILSKDQEAENTQEAGLSEASNTEDKSLETESQNFFPSFADLISNHRRFAEQQRFRFNRFLGYFQRDRNAYQTAVTTAKDVQHPILGSGNFGVIRGGTYYPEDKESDEYSIDESLYNPYYSAASNRARANYYRNPKPQPVREGDFFANFRDFADITAPPKSSFSHLSVVYANKNGTSTGRITEPRNIIETLRMLEEEDQSNSQDATTTEVPRKKLSKGKRKLIKKKQYEEDKARRSRMSVEPLLALS